MKDKILKSNRYKRYLFYIYLSTGILIFVVLVMLLLTFIELLNPIENYNPWKSFLITTGTFAIFFLPFTFIYLLKCLLIKFNIANYKRYIGIATNVETSKYIRSNHKLVTIKVGELTNQLHTKVYKGDLYDKVEKNVKLEVVFNESKHDVIIINTL